MVTTPLIHHPDYDALSVADEHRFPMRKYSLVAQMLRQQGRVFEEPQHAPQVWLEAVHDPRYVEDVLTCSLDPKAARIVGFDITPAIAARSRASVGGTVHAALCAMKTGRAVNLAGGSHHAGPSGGAGFCVFNDAAVAARHLIQTGVVKRAAILDLDVHHGDGTALCFADDDSVFTASVHCEENWPRQKPPSDFDLGLARGTSDADYLAAVNVAIEAVTASGPVDIVFYNAGVDPHRDDRLGLLNLSDEGLYQRDRAVIEAFKTGCVPVVGVLGGGYEKDAEAVAKRHLFLVEAMDAVWS